MSGDECVTDEHACPTCRQPCGCEGGPDRDACEHECAFALPEAAAPGGA